MEDLSNLGERLKRIREDRGRSVVEVARALGCHKTNLAHIEAGRQKPSVEQLVILAKVYGASIDEMLGGIEPQSPQVLIPAGGATASRSAAGAGPSDFERAPVTREMTGEQILAVQNRGAVCPTCGRDRAVA